MGLSQNLASNAKRIQVNWLIILPQKSSESIHLDSLNIRSKIGRGSLSNWRYYKTVTG